MKIIQFKKFLILILDNIFNFKLFVKNLLKIYID